MKIYKGQLGFNGSYPRWKPIKGGSDKRKENAKKAIQSCKSLHQRDEAKLEIFSTESRSLDMVAFWGKEFWNSDLDDLNVHCSNALLYIMFVNMNSFVIIIYFLNENPFDWTQLIVYPLHNNASYIF